LSSSSASWPRSRFEFANTKERRTWRPSRPPQHATTQESYFADYQIYIAGTANNTAAGTSSVYGFVPSAGVTVTTAATGGTGWSATSGHSATTKTCAIFVGVGAVAPATVEAEPKCQ
jgi:hypothetical protein